MVCLHDIRLNSTIFTTKNKELAIFGKTLSETRGKVIEFFTAFKRGGIKGQDGIIDTFFSKDKKSPLTPELLANLERFKEKFNNSILSAEALAEQMKNVDQRIIDYAKTCKNGAMTTKGFKESIDAMTLSAKAGKAVLQALATIGNMALMYGAAKLIGAFIGFIDGLHTTLKEQQEITQNLQGELSEIQSDISEVNSELETTAKRIDELNSKDSLSFVEKGELENLTAQNEELERRNKLLAEREANKQQEIAQSVEQEFQKEYGRETYHRITSQQILDEMSQKRARYNELYINNGYNTEEELAELEQLKQELAAWDSTASSVSFSEHIQETINAYELLNRRVKEGETLSKQETDQLTGYRKALVDYNVDLEDYIGRYGLDDEVSQSWRDLSDSIYECLYPAEYLTSQFDETFHNLSEDIQTELRQLAQNGTLSVDNLSDEIISKFSEAGFSASEVIEQLLSTYEDFSSAITRTPSVPPLSVTETVSRLDTRLRSAFSSLRSAYQEIFTPDEAAGETRFSLDGADITDKFSPILDAIKSLGELDGITVDYSAFDDFVSVLSDTSSTEADVQAQFDSLATSIIYASDCTNMSAETFNLLAESLSELGISNARETLKDILALQQSLAAAGIDAQTAMSGEADALQNLQIAGTETAEQLMAYYIQKQLAENPLTTLNDILQLENLCNALGVTGEMLQTITALKLAFEAKESGAHAGGLDESIKAYQERLKELAAGYGTYGFEFGGAGTRTGSSSPASASRSAAETFDWTAQALERTEKELSALDDIADSSYSTLAQKNEALAQQIGKVNDAVALGQQAYNTYMQKAEAVGLSGHYKDLAQSGSPGMEDITDETLKNQISEYQKWYEKAQETQTKIDSLYEKAKDIHVSSYENYVQELDTLRDNDTISEREYLDRMNALWEHYYADQTKYAVQAKEAKLKLLKDEKSYLESVANTAADLLGGQIDELKNRQEAEIEVLEAKKRPLEVQLELLEKQKEEEDRILSLQKAQYELKRAEQQRDKLTYVDGQMIYRADETNLRNARDAVDEAKYNIEKASIEDRINAYDKEIDKIKERYDAEIAGMERLENEWQNALALRERAQSFGDFESMFGEGSAARLLDGDSSFISTWKQTYLNTLGGIDMVSGGMIGEMTTRYAELAGLDLSNITEQTKTVASQFHAVNDAVNSLNNAIGTESPNTENNAPADKPSANAESASLSDALQNTYDVASEVLPEEAAMLNAVTEAANTAAAAVNELKTAIASLNALSLTPDSIAVSGSAYASGTRHAKKGLAIVGEEKPEMIITTDQKAYLAKQPTLLRMEGGETVLSGDETAKMLKARGFQPIKPDEFPLLKAFAAYSPEEIRQRFAPQMISPAGTTASAALQNAEHAVNNNSINNTPFYTTGDIHIHCPGITKDEVARQIGTELTNVFSGLSLKAYQRASITR